MRLLLAEDERALSKALATILERSNYSVDTVYDGEAALEYLASQCSRNCGAGEARSRY